MRFSSNANVGATYHGYGRRDEIGVMIEMTPSEPSTTFLAPRDSESDDGNDDVAKPFPPSQRGYENDLDTGRPTFRHTTSLQQEAAKDLKLRELEAFAAKLDGCKDYIALIAGAFRGKVRNSMLFSLLHNDATAGMDEWDRDVIQNEKKKLLQHPVMRLIVILKWRAFGVRMFSEQLLMHLLLLLTLTVSLTISLGTIQGDPKDDPDGDKEFKKIAGSWLCGTALLLLSLLATRFLTWQNKQACAWATLVLGGCAITAIFLNLDHLVELCYSDAFVNLNNGLVSLCAVYFCIFELRELAADYPDYAVFLSGDSLMYWRLVHVPTHFITSIYKLVCTKTPSPYLESYWNRIQLPLFLLVLVYALCELWTYFPFEMCVYLGIPMHFVLCLMCVQYLEAFRDVGYLLPMMRRMLTDVFRYLAFYLPIQCGYACAYYLLFKSQGENLKPYKPDEDFADNFNSSLSKIFPGANTTDETLVMNLLEILKTKDSNDIFQGYETVPKSFLTTYLVTFAQINMEPFNQLASPAAYVLGYLLLVTHATIVIVMLLNVLIAMMDKTMGAHMDEAKLEACVTFAECVLRLEKTTTSAISDEYWGNLNMDKVENLYEEIVRADANEKRDDDAVLDALALLGANVDDLEKRA
ncbi:hypothetical protein SDRG_16514 [Saprolegnia diclina VS20]|uniref:Ion transport domain-containing protein n=1 Tax=Saprolegnia diclina (strain VS20) TaxID=1156394 RepID=T0R0W0_SAPDV|nr:hypothetical protein SDRG_16514 [Saprolegnia diclina VS20]EQC25618.1 hypothetical protein SDRG_16514 [Saprolegnia diclina VS20]|eukprot:XP_008620950.1 hypothetical protein SDRG_16514 [Saprolegnia diclina VS20]